LPAAIAAISLALWETAARASWISALFFPPPTQILLTLARMSGSAEFWAALGMTCLRLASGVAIGCGAGLVLGWVMGANRAVRVAVDPIVAALHPLPKLAIFPIFLVLLGIGEASKVALLATVAFFPMVINTLAGVRQIDRAHWEAAANYGATGRTLLRRVIVPGSLPMALVGLRLAVNTALVVAIAVEMLSAQEGLGARIWLAWQTLRVQELYAILAVIALLGWVLHWLLATAAIRLAPWHGDARLDS
jgi:NitT/TauT family transport system permease protein